MQGLNAEHVPNFGCKHLQHCEMKLCAGMSMECHEMTCGMLTVRAPQKQGSVCRILTPTYQ